LLEADVLPAELVEERVERLYDRTLLTKAEIAEVRRVLDEEIHRIDEENRTVVEAQQQRLKRLTEEERQNAAAYRADALSIEALKAERERIDKEPRKPGRAARQRATPQGALRAGGTASRGGRAAACFQATEQTEPSPCSSAGAGF
jgi:uncharacterized protein YqgQ